MKWSIFISVFTFFLASVLSASSKTILDGVNWGFGMLIVFSLILLGVFFDILGLASAAAHEVPFHAMASKKVHGSKHAIQIVRNADRFSNFCNDVIGDISGIISGTASALVILKLLSTIDGDHFIIQTVITVVFAGAVSALTVGGKALGKSFAIHYATEIILVLGKLFYFLEVRCHITLFGKNKPKATSGKRGNKRAAGTNQSA